MMCPKCGGKSKVINSRLAMDQDEEVRVRCRRCEDCAHTFYTIEYEIDFSQGLDLINQHWRVHK